MKKFLLILLTCILTACGGGGSSGGTSTTGSGNGGGTIVNNNNAIAISVSSGPQNNYLNGLFGSITLCNSNNACTTVNNVIFDTGSVGIRILGSALPNNFLTANSNGSGGTYSNCGVFADGFTWGDLSSATITLGNLKSTTSVPVQVIGQSSFPVPSGCSSGNGTQMTTLSALGANGIVGIGLFKSDCGITCANNPTTSYYACTAGSCVESVIPTTSQLVNPVSVMPANYNNGTVISLPSISSNGAQNVQGNIYLGIGTSSNNSFTPSNVYNTDSNGYINISLGGNQYTQSFLDSGSSIYGFNNNNLQLCNQANFTTYYCPTATSTLNLSIVSNVNANQSGVSSITIDNAYTLLNNTNNSAFDNVANQFTSSSSVDLGLTFFFGKKVATGIEGASSNIGTGTYFAF